MFALIIAIIAIALTVYLAVSTLFYGGDALSNGSARAIASSFINQGQQISGAHTLYKNDNAGARSTDVATLVTGEYLSSIPAPSKGTVWAVDGTQIVSNSEVGNLIPVEVCDIINAQAGDNGTTFGCDDEATPGPQVWYRF